jgi:prepilin-type N-terminal cleavage/methylation domain-containing protein
MMQPRKAFTLMELLVVIGIIGILAGMVFAGVQVAKASSLKTKTTSILSQVSSALNSYRLLNGSYPDSFGVADPTDDYGDVFGSASNPVLATDASLDAARWKTVNGILATQLAAAGFPMPSPIVDSWGHALHYRPAKYYPFKDAGALVEIDKDTNVPGRDSFQLWSVGKNNADEFGEKKYAGRTGDDLTSWSQ